MRKLKVAKAKIGVWYHGRVLNALDTLYKASILSIDAIWKPSNKHFMKLLTDFEYLVDEGEAKPTDELNEKLSKLISLYKSIRQ